MFVIGLLPLFFCLYHIRKDVLSLSVIYVHLPFPYILIKLFQVFFYSVFSKTSHFIEKK